MARPCGLARQGAVRDAKSGRAPSPASVSFIGRRRRGLEHRQAIVSALLPAFGLVFGCAHPATQSSPPAPVKSPPAEARSTPVHGAATEAHDPSYGIECAGATCRPGEEVCCLHGEHRCVPSQSDGSLSCIPEGFLACDDSNDCPSASVCKTFGTDWIDAQCVDLEEQAYRGAGPFEICTPGSQCRTPRTSCREGLCRAPRPPVTIPCGDVECSAGAPVCCISTFEDERHCSASCELGERGFECRDARDCPARELCTIAPLGDQYCGTLSFDIGVACAVDSECEVARQAYPHMGIHCVNGSCEGS